MASSSAVVFAAVVLHCVLQCDYNNQGKEGHAKESLS